MKMSKMNAVTKLVVVVALSAVSIVGAPAHAASGWSITDLGTLGGLVSYAYGINDSGQVVGFSLTPANDFYHAFLYSGGVMTDLNTLIDPALGWTLTEARGINDLGQIVGYGDIGGNTRAFIMTPVPEPEIYAMLLAGLGLMGFLARRRRQWQDNAA